jgi:L,D-transpeptidase ErfK/SrfK
VIAIMKAKICFFIGLLAICLIIATRCTALADDGGIRSFALDPGQSVIGKLRWSYALKRDTLLDIARDYGLGYNAITDANPGIDPWLPGNGEKVAVPSYWILPDAKRQGIVINLAEMRIYYFHAREGNRYVDTYPIGVGREGFDTPLGVYHVTGKEKDPYWYPPESIRQEKPELPPAVPPGPDNPLGAYKIMTDLKGYLIHGTNRPWGVGRRVSHGCIRLYPEDIARLYADIRPGERVEIVYQPVKAGLEDGRPMVEVHKDYLGGTDLFKEAVVRLYAMGLLGSVDLDRLLGAVDQKSGIPTDVGITLKP